MRPVHTICVLFRLTVAMVFGFMSLGHTPVMAFAKAHQPAAIERTAAHQHHVAHDAVHTLLDKTALPSDQVPECPAICTAVACFVLITPAAVTEPSCMPLPLGKLSPGLARAMTPAVLDPLVPPPRLQA